MEPPLIEFDGVTKTYGTGQAAVHALAGVNLQQEWYVLRSRERGAPRAVQELYSFIASKDARKLIAKDGLKVPSD